MKYSTGSVVSTIAMTVVPAGHWMSQGDHELYACWTAMLCTWNEDKLVSTVIEKIKKSIYWKSRWISMIILLDLGLVGNKILYAILFWFLIDYEVGNWWDCSSSIIYFSLVWFWGGIGPWKSGKTGFFKVDFKFVRKKYNTLTQELWRLMFCLLFLE